MIQKEKFKRYSHSRLNLITTICAIMPLLISYYSTWNEKSNWIKQLAKGAEDLNVQVTQQLVDGYCGISYLINFFFSSDLIVIFSLILAISMNCVVGADMYDSVKSGWGNLIITRSGYRRYLNDTLKAQMFYVFSFCGIFFLIIIIGTLLFFPAMPNGPLSSDLYFLRYETGITYASLFTLQSFLIAIFVAFSVAFTTLSTFLYSNKYLVLGTPLYLYFIPLLLANTLGLINYGLGLAIEFIMPDNYLQAIMTRYSSSTSVSMVTFSILILPLIYTVLGFVLYRCNCNFYEEQYL